MTRTRRFVVLWGVLLLVLLPGVFLALLLGTEIGLRYALKQTGYMLADGQVQYERVQGSLWRGAHIEGLRWTSMDFDLEVGELNLRLDLTRLPWRELRVDGLDAVAVRLTLPQSEDDALGEALFPLQWPAVNMPVSLFLDQGRIDGLVVVAGAKTPVEITRVMTRGRLEHGVLTLERLIVVEAHGKLDVSGRIDTRHHYQTELIVGITPQAPQWAFELAIAGDLRVLRVRSEGAEALPLGLDLEMLAMDHAHPRWRVGLRGQAIDPSRWVDSWNQGTVDLDLSVEGDLLRQRLAGRLHVGGRDIALESLELRYFDARIDFDELSLREGEQSVRGHGHLLLTMPLSGRAELDFTGLVSPPAAPAARVSGRLAIDGALPDWTLALSSDVMVEGVNSRIVLDGKGDIDGFRIVALEAATDLGRLQGEGHIDWRDGLVWWLRGQAHQFEPQRLGLPLVATLDLRFFSAGRWGVHGPEGRLELDDIAGTLSGAVLAGQASVVIEDLEHWRAEAAIAVDDGRLSGGVRTHNGAMEGRLDVVAFDPGRLGLPVSMSASGGLRFGGRIDAPSLDIDLGLSEVRTALFTVAAARIDGRMASGGEVALTLALEQAEVEGLRLDTGAVSVDGDLREHRVEAVLRGAPGHLALSAQGGLADGDWRGRLQQLEAEVVHAGLWQLQAPVTLAFGVSGVTVERACLSGATHGRLCARAQLSVDGDVMVAAELEALSLALFSPFLFRDGFRRMDGSIAGRVEAHRESGIWRGETSFAAPIVTLFLEPAGVDDSALRLDTLRLEARLAADTADARVEAGIGADGRLNGALLAIAADDTWALDGRLDLDMAAAGLESWARELDNVQGRIEATASVAGTLGEPVFDAQATVRGFAADVTAIGIELREGELSATTESVQQIVLTGSVRSGAGSVALTGDYDIASEALGLRFEGEGFTAVSLPQARVDISPRLSLRYREGNAHLDGNVTVPSALIDLSRFEGADRPSADVIVLEGGREVGGAERLPLTARITVALGDDVRLKGFGLDGRLSGSLNVRETPGQAPTGQGNIEVSGRFSAYGRELDIERGRLLFSGALDNPLLDVRAERVIEEITVGVQASGEAQAPQLMLYSRPAMAQSDILAYLVVGRPLSAVRSGEGELLSDAATALGTASGDLLARQLGARMGLDLGVEASSELGAALTVGKYLSPRLYLGYGVSLFGSGQAVILRYLISQAWSVEVESGTENKATLDYRLER